MKRILFLVFLFACLCVMSARRQAASVLQAAEFEVVDQFTVDGATILKSSVQVIVPDIDLPFSLWVSTSAITPHLYVSTNGNVGIWTATPESKLEINGTSKFNGIINTNNQWISGDGGAEGIYIKDDGNVGIGTTSPSWLLDVKGSAAANSGLIRTRNTYTNGEAGILFQNDARAWNTYVNSSDKYTIRDDTGATDRITIDTSGNVGIGTVSPGYKLDVNGDARFYSGNSVYTIDGLFNANATPVVVTTPGGVGRIKLGYYDQGGGQYWGRLGFVGNTNWSLGTAAGGDSFGIGRNYSGADILIDNTGNVGIGTTEPSSKLHVTGASDDLVRIGNGSVNPVGAGQLAIYPAIGDAAISLDGANVINAGNLFFRGGGAPLAQIYGGASGTYEAGKGGYLSFHTVPYQGVVTEQMRILYNGNVGIGTTNPGAKLDINSGGTTKMLLGANTSNTNYNAISLNGDNTDNARIGMTGGGSADGRLYLDAVTNITFRPGSSATQAMTILSGGNVGIGTTAPKNKLDVEGGAVIGATYSGTNTAPSNGILVQGNVGIGTTSPGTKLDVDGSITQSVTHGDNIKLWLSAARNGDATGEVGLYSWISEPGMSWTGGGIARNMYNTTSFPRVNTSLSGQMLHFTEGGNVEFTLTSVAGAQTTPFVILPSGNVGIGTTEPGEKLDVNGTIEVNQKIQAHDSGGLELATDEGTTRLFIKDNGNVGIGTTAPITSLHIYKAGAGVSSLNFEDSSEAAIFIPAVTTTGN